MLLTLSCIVVLGETGDSYFGSDGGLGPLRCKYSSGAWVKIITAIYQMHTSNLIPCLRWRREMGILLFSGMKFGLVTSLYNQDLIGCSDSTLMVEFAQNSSWRS